MEKNNSVEQNENSEERQEIHKNGFGKLCGFLQFIAIHTILGVMVGITFWIVDREHFLATMPVCGFLIGQSVISWAAIANSKGFPVFKASRRLKNPFMKSAKKADEDLEKPV